MAPCCTRYNGKSLSRRFFLFKNYKSYNNKTLLSPSGPIHALRPNFRPIGSVISAEIEHKKIEKSRRVNHIRSPLLRFATLRYATQTLAASINSFRWYYFIKMAICPRTFSVDQYYLLNVSEMSASSREAIRRLSGNSSFKHDSELDG